MAIRWVMMSKKKLKEDFFNKYNWAKKSYYNLGLYYDPVNFLIATNKDKITFESYLESQGHKLIKPTNIYEMIRFISCCSKSCVIYQGKKGIKYSNDLAYKIHDSWENPPKKSKKYLKEKQILLEFIESLKNKKGIYKHISNEMDMDFNKESIDFIDDVSDLRLVTKITKQYKELFDDK